MTPASSQAIRRSIGCCDLQNFPDSLRVISGGGDTELFQKCLGPIDDTLKQFALNLDPEASSCRGEEKTIPRPRTVRDHPLLRAPVILYEHLEKAFGWELLYAVGGCIVFLCLMSMVMVHRFLVGPAKKTKKKKPQ